MQISSFVVHILFYLLIVIIFCKLKYKSSGQKSCFNIILMAIILFNLLVIFRTLSKIT